IYRAGASELSLWRSHNQDFQAGSVEVEVAIFELEFSLAVRSRRTSPVPGIESEISLSGLRWVCNERPRRRIDPPAACDEPGIGIKDDQYVAETPNRIRSA